MAFEGHRNTPEMLDAFRYPKTNVDRAIVELNFRISRSALAPVPAAKTGR